MGGGRSPGRDQTSAMSDMSALTYMAGVEETNTALGK
jgi:hypothetical protein